MPSGLAEFWGGVPAYRLHHRVVASDEVVERPAPVTAAVVLTVLTACVSLLSAVSVFFHSSLGNSGFFFLYLGLVPVAVAAAIGVWQARRGARVVTIIIGVLAVVPGGNDLTPLGAVLGLLGWAVFGLVTLPPSARRWFSARRI